MSYLGVQTVKTARIETEITATNNQTTFNPNGGYQRGFIDVYVDGIKKVSGTDFTATDGVSVVFTSHVTNNSIVSLVAFGPVNMASVVSRSGDSITGDLTLPNLTASANVEANNINVTHLDVANSATFHFGANINGITTQTGDMTVAGNLTIDGSLSIIGSASEVTTSSLSVDDTIIKLGGNNSADVLDIGFAGAYSNGSANLYAGVIRDGTLKKFYFFKDYTAAVNNNIDTGDASFAVANVVGNFEGNLTANSILTDTVSSGNISLTAGIHVTGDATGYRQTMTTSYGGAAGTAEGRIEYHANAWNFNAGSDSANLAVYRRGGTIVSYIDNTGASFYANGTQIGGGGAEPAGPNTSIQFNESDALAGNSQLTYDSASDTLTLGNIQPSSNNTYSIGNSTVKHVTMHANTFEGTATSAQYGDLAEKYTSDKEYKVGTIMSVSSNVSYELCPCKVDDIPIGVISDKPGFIMNSQIDGLLVGLKGRVPIFVSGPVNKGESVNVYDNGSASVNGPGQLVGVSLETNLDNDIKLVECILKV